MSLACMGLSAYLNSFIGQPSSKKAKNPFKIELFFCFFDHISKTTADRGSGMVLNIVNDSQSDTWG